MTTHHNHSIRGILFMIMHALSVAVIFTTMKYLTQSFAAVELVFFYKIMLLAISTVWVLFKGVKCLIIKEIKLVMWRGVLSTTASLSFMYALQYVDMVNATALGYLEQVIWVILGVTYFQEKLSFSRLILVSMSIFGALIIIFPTSFNTIYNIIGFEQGVSHNTFEWHYLLVMLAVICWGINAGIIKRLGKTVKVEVQLFYTMLFATIVSFCMAYVKWTMIDLHGLPILLPAGLSGIDPDILKFESFQFLILTTICYFLHSICFYFALQNAPFIVVIPFDYLRLLFAGLLSYLVLNTIPEFNAYIGYCLILSSSIILTQLEYRSYKRKR